MNLPTKPSSLLSGGMLLHLGDPSIHLFLHHPHHLRHALLSDLRSIFEMLANPPALLGMATCAPECPQGCVI